MYVYMYVCKVIKVTEVRADFIYITMHVCVYICIYAGLEIRIKK